MKARRPIQAVPRHHIHIFPPPKLRRWRIDRLAWGDFAWLLLTIGAILWIAWQIWRFQEGLS